MGLINKEFEFYNIRTEIGYNISYKCITEGLGETCSPTCQLTNETNDCNSHSKDAICKPGKVLICYKFKIYSIFYKIMNNI